MKRRRLAEYAEAGMDVIKLGIIGAGLAVRKLHWPVLQKMSREVQIVAVASRTQEKAEELARLVGAAQSINVSNLLVGAFSK